ncbi:hypothetical protein SESBI_35443 [Sesbania bispinosa]|nr:hypothetical protein SESBI_35443 [Sesbania bispinosa]
MAVAAMHRLLHSCCQTRPLQHHAFNLVASHASPCRKHNSGEEKRPNKMKKRRKSRRRKCEKEEIRGKNF